MTKLTDGERLIVLETNVKSIETKLDQYLKESRDFHTELLGKLDRFNVSSATANEALQKQITDDQKNIIRLQDRVSLLLWIAGLATTASVIAIINSIFKLITL